MFIGALYLSALSRWYAELKCKYFCPELLTGRISAWRLEPLVPPAGDLVDVQQCQHLEHIAYLIDLVWTLCNKTGVVGLAGSFFKIMVI